MSRHISLTFGLKYLAAVGLLAMTWSAQLCQADFPIIGFDSLMIQKGNGREMYGAMGTFIRADPNSPDPNFPVDLPGGPQPGVIINNGFDSFDIHAQIVSQFGSEFDLKTFGGVGGRFYEAQGVGDLPGTGHDVYGTSFDPNDYWLDVTYKLGPNNQATRFDISLDQHDGFADGNPAGTQSQGEQFTFQFEDIVNRYNSGTQDSDGFVTLRRDITQLPNPVTGDPTTPWDARAKASNVTNDGDSLMDFDAFEGGVRNGIRRIQLKSVSVNGFENQEILNVSIKSVKLVPKVSVPEVARLDGNTGFSSGFAAAGGKAVVSRANGNLQLDFVGSSGAQINQVVTNFDGTQYGVEVKAKLLPGSDSLSFRVVAKDLDGNDDAPGRGAEEFALSFNTSLFNETDFTTVFIPWTDALAPNNSFGFVNTGDGSLVDFNLYQFQVANNGATNLKLEVESIKIIPIPSTSLPGDFDGDGDVDGRDFLAWQRNPTAGNLADWQNNYPPTSLVATTAVPEPGALCLMFLAGVGAVAWRRPARSLG